MPDAGCQSRPGSSGLNDLPPRSKVSRIAGRTGISSLAARASHGARTMSRWSAIVSGRRHGSLMDVASADRLHFSFGEISNRLASDQEFPILPAHSLLLHGSGRWTKGVASRTNQATGPGQGLVLTQPGHPTVPEQWSRDRSSSLTTGLPQHQRCLRGLLPFRIR